MNQYINSLWINSNRTLRTNNYIILHYIIIRQLQAVVFMEIRQFLLAQ